MFEIALNFWLSWFTDSTSTFLTDNINFFNWSFTGYQLIQLVSVASCFMVICLALWIVIRLIAFILSFTSRW